MARSVIFLRNGTTGVVLRGQKSDARDFSVWLLRLGRRKICQNERRQLPDEKVFLHKFCC